jgi:beta-barrel assembly-enhancing protease
MRTDWEARYFDGRSAAALSVTIRITPTGLHVLRPDGVVHWPFDTVSHRHSGLARGHVRLERAGADGTEALVIQDSAFLIDLHRIGGAYVRHIANPSRRVPMVPLIAGLSVVTILFCVVVFRWGIPWLAAQGAEQLPVEWEEKIGREYALGFVEEEMRCEDAQLRTFIDTLVTRLDRAAQPHPYTLNVVVVDHEAVNALAAPGGQIVIFTGLLRAAKTPRMVAGVLAHEVAHVMHQHATQKLFAQFTTALLASAMTGVDTGFLETVMNGAQEAGVMHFSRSMEAEADRVGLTLLQRARIDPRGLAEFFKTIQDTQSDIPDFLHFLSSHPATQERLELLNAHTDATQYDPIPLPDNIEWKTLAEKCH